MQNKAWNYTMLATLLGAVGVLLHWLQCMIIYDAETGLPNKGAFISVLVTVFLAAAYIVMWLYVRRIDESLSPEEPEDALCIPLLQNRDPNGTHLRARKGEENREPRYNREIGPVLIAVSALSALGAVLLFLKADDLFLRTTALVGLLAAPVPALLPYAPRWGGIGAFLSVLPVAFFSMWLVGFYRDNAVNPVVWRYGVQVLAIAACLLASFRVSGYLFYRARPRRALLACGVALIYCMSVLMDDDTGAARILFAGWGIAYACIGWLLVRNLREPPEEEEL